MAPLGLGFEMITMLHLGLCVHMLSSLKNKNHKYQQLLLITTFSYFMVKFNLHLSHVNTMLPSSEPRDTGHKVKVTQTGTAAPSSSSLHYLWEEDLALGQICASDGLFRYVHQSGLVTMGQCSHVEGFSIRTERPFLAVYQNGRDGARPPIYFLGEAELGKAWAPQPEAPMPRAAALCMLMPEICRLCRACRQCASKLSTPLTCRPL